jgi:CRISPR-associated protein Cmr3
MTTIGLKLQPLDVLFFRDGRPFGAATRGQSGLPLPQTLAGAIWTALLERQGCDFNRLAQALREDRARMAEAIRRAGGKTWTASVQVRGPWLARHEMVGCDESCESHHDSHHLPENAGNLGVLVPSPAVLVAEKNGDGAGHCALHRLCPLPSDGLPGWQPPESAPDLRPLWLRHPQPTEPAKGYLTRAGLEKFLRNEHVQATGVIPPGDLFEYDDRTGIGIDPERLSAEEGLIYGASFLALKPNVGLYAEVILPDDADSNPFGDITTLAFGGEGRRVAVHVLRQAYQWPEPRPAGAGQKPMLLLTTPGFFAERWRPAALNGRLVAAAVPGADPVSGWDLARGGPKPNRFAAQAGSTYFLNEPLNPWPDALSDNDFDRQQGWGCYLKGVWTDEQR